MGLDAPLALGDAAQFDATALFGRAQFDRILFSYTLSMIPPWKQALDHGCTLLATGGSIHVVDFGQQERLPRWFGPAFRAYLARFHVTPRADLFETGAELAERHGLQFEAASPYRDYARLMVLRRRVTGFRTSFLKSYPATAVLDGKWGNDGQYRRSSQLRAARQRASGRYCGPARRWRPSCLFAAMAWPGGAPEWIVPFAFLLVLSQAAMSWMLGTRSTGQIERARDAAGRAHSIRASQIEQLFAMADMLQSAENHEDAGAVLEATAKRLLPDFRGALYIFNNSRDRLDLATNWPRGEATRPAEALVPGNCWALKRGKFHINDPHAGTLCCMHNGGVMSTIEVPMIARGKVHGLLMLATDAPDSTEVLQGISRMARALADSMSLALANIGLQEKLRTQSLRDPLTGLYNRRYMEDALDRYLNMAERSGQPTSVVMIDLDNFKKLNDTHGHAKGDTVLREVAGQLVGHVEWHRRIFHVAAVVEPGRRIARRLRAELLLQPDIGERATSDPPKLAPFG